MERRYLLAGVGASAVIALNNSLTGAVAALAPHVPLASVRAHRRIGAGEIERIAGRAGYLKAIDLAHGGDANTLDYGRASVQHTAMLFIDEATSMLSADCPANLVPELLTNVAQLHLAAGWLKFDSSLHHSAAKYWEVGQEAARQAGNDLMLARIQGSLSRQASWIGKPDDGLKLAERALTLPGLPHTERSRLHALRARALGGMENLRQTQWAIGMSDEEYALSDRDDVLPPWAAFSPGDQHGDTARALSDLVLTGHGPAQFSILEGRYALSVKNHDPVDRARSKLFTLANFAAAQMTAGDPEQAVALGLEAVTLAPNVASQRANQEFRILRGACSHHDDRSDVQDLRREIDRVLPV